MTTSGKNPPGAARCFLFDNGSLNPASTLSLRRLGKGLQARLPMPVEAVSLLHSSAVNPDELGGVRARLLEIALIDFFGRTPDGQAVLLPLFFGPSGALTAYLPLRIKALQARFPLARIRTAPCVVRPEYDPAREIVDTLRDRVLAVTSKQGLTRPRVILVDHGSPKRRVTDIRNFLAQKLSEALGPDAESVTAASMESRPEPRYAFNQPLLETCLRTAPFNEGPVVIALQFFSPGRHAGEDGDIAQICREAEKENPRLRTHLTETLASDPRLVEVLVRRYAEALQPQGEAPVAP